MRQYLELFNKIWEAPSGKKLTAIFMIIPIFLVFFYQYNTTNLREDLKDCKRENIRLSGKVETIQNIYVTEVKNCGISLQKNDEIHRLEFEAYREKTEKKVDSIRRDWKSEYEEVKDRLYKTEEFNKLLRSKIK